MPKLKLSTIVFCALKQGAVAMYSPVQRTVASYRHYSTNVTYSNRSDLKMLGSTQ